MKRPSFCFWCVFSKFYSEKNGIVRRNKLVFQINRIRNDYADWFMLEIIDSNESGKNDSVEKNE